MAIGSFVALGDSFTEGLDDPRADQAGYLGWADRFAGMLAGQWPGLRYANLAVRGKLLREVAEEQVSRVVRGWRRLLWARLSVFADSFGIAAAEEVCTGGELTRDQIVPTLILKPVMIAAIDVQQHAGQRTTFTSFTVHSALGLALYQTGRLQRLFDPRVAQADLMVLDELLVKVPHVQIEVFVPVKAQNLFGLLFRNATVTRCTSPPVQ